MSGTGYSETAALIALLQASKSSWSTIRLRLEDTDPSQLLREVLPPSLLDEDYNAAVGDAVANMAEWLDQGIAISSPYSSDYPGQLRAVHDYPPLLFARGQFCDADAESVAVVGTRAPSEGAVRFIRQLVPMLAHEGITVTSGLAKGVDSEAMRASMDAGNRTVGIIGTGLNRSYPTENADLQAAVAKQHLLLSQFWPDAPPTKHSFPMRNHVMSAYSCMTLIVEAGENSGTRIQARAATKHARPLIITRAVFLATNWAKELVNNRFDVTVVANPAEAFAAVKRIHSRSASRVQASDDAFTLDSLSA
jgi:DNA processing protein